MTHSNDLLSTWQPRSWRDKTAKQLPHYQDEMLCKKICDQIHRLPPLVFGREAEKLRIHFANVAKGKAFILQGGDCAESFQDLNANYIRDTFKVLMQMAVVITFAGGVPVIKIGRMAGQYAKPRSNETETIKGRRVLSYKGDNINHISAERRDPDPRRMLEGYHHAAATLNLLRAFAEGGLADLNLVHRWMLDFVKDSPAKEKFEDLSLRIDDAMRFMDACGVNSAFTSSLKRTDFFTSHEALLLPFEEAMTRRDSLTHQWFDCSAHMLWIGDRTRELDHAHVEFCRGIANPIGIKCGPSVKGEELVELIYKLNPNHEEGRIVLIIRMGHEKIAAHLPDIIRFLQKQELAHKVAWVCDPMHGNTVKTENQVKTRRFGDICSEIEQFFHIHADAKTYAGGIHLELTGQDVTECSGGGQQISDADLQTRYHTHCDPRLNAQQSLEVAFHVAEYIRRQQQRS